MRLCFIGASAFGLRCLETVIEIDSLEVVGAVTAPQTFPISYRPHGVTNVLHADVRSFCNERRIPNAIIQKGMKDSELFAQVRSWRPDLFLVAGWYHMVPREWRQFAHAYGLHASLLPDYSGGAPLVWAMINGETRTGISLFRLSDGVDDGPLLGQLETPILADDTIATLYARIETLGIELVRKHLPKLADGTAALTEQDHGRRRVFPQRGPEDGKIDWAQSSRCVYDFVRAQTRPYPGAFMIKDGKKLTVWSCVDCGNATESLPPGEIRRVKNAVLVGCGHGTAVMLNRVAQEGEDMDALQWWERFYVGQ